MNFFPKPGQCGWGPRGHGARLSHFYGDHDSVNIDAKEPQCGITATPSQQRDPRLEHMGTQSLG